MLDLALLLRRRTTKEILLAAGGRWDRIEKRFTGERPRFHVIDLEESQIEFTRWFAGFLCDLREGRPRDCSLALAAGERRGGKTFNLLVCALALLIDVPAIPIDGGSPTVGWVVSASYQERDELDKIIREYIPPAWYTHRKAPEFRYTFAHGSSLRNVSADDPESLKRGRVDCVLYNEAQKIPIAALSNGIYGTADKGGIALLAANPPRRTIGEWVFHLKQAIDERAVQGARYFGFSSKDNTCVDQPARERVGEILRLLDPRAAKADDEGLWLPVGDRAYPKWSKKLVEKTPEISPKEITAPTLERLTFVRYRFVAGADFQGRPHQAGAVLRIFAGDDGPIYWFVDELIVEGTELHLSDEAYAHGYTPETLLWVPDASGSFQDAKHSGNTTSYDALRSQRWNVQAPTEIKRPDRSRHPKNPDVDQRLGIMYRLMEAGRLRVDPRCKWLIESFRECPLGNNRFGKRKPYGKHSHITDAAGYAIYFLEPKPTDPIEIAPADIKIVRFKRRGSDFY